MEDCLVLKVDKLVRDGMIRTTLWQGKLIWTNTATGKEVASAGCTYTPLGSDWVFTLIYSITRGDEEKREITLPIRLQTTFPHFGGVRWWFTCPLTKGGAACGRRVGRLYLPPGGLYYGCRHCYDLTYTSSQESHKYDRMWRELAARMGTTPDVVRDVLDGRSSRDW